ncbi:hypothetical protein BASA81_001820 [Batrachochytrium salamandrivorans]|nr:hypothetical protein BASA81_001820 [Batrachochytrium salamandrivorans]
MESSSALRLSSWLLSATSVWALTFSDLVAEGEKQAPTNMLLLVLGACALTWASPLSQLAGTRSKPGFHLVSLFRGGNSTILLQAFAWSCYGVAVFGCTLALVNPEIRLRGLRTGLCILGFASLILIEMSIAVFQDLPKQHASPSSFTVSIYSVSKLAQTLVCAVLTLAGFAIAIAGEGFALPLQSTCWNLTVGLYLVSFTLSQFSMGFQLVEEEKKTLCRLFAFLLLASMLWIFSFLNQLKSTQSSSIRGSTFGLGLDGFLACMLSLYSQWMPNDKPAFVAEATTATAATVPLPLNPSPVYYLAVVLSAAAWIVRVAVHPLSGVAVCLLGCILAHFGAWLNFRSSGMRLAQPLQGGSMFVVGQGVGWMAFSIALGALLVIWLNLDMLDLRDAYPYAFNCAFLAHVCLLVSEPYFQAATAYAQPTMNNNNWQGSDLRLIALLVGSFLLQTLAELASLSLTLAAAVAFVSFPRQRFAWTWIVGLTLVQLVGISVQQDRPGHPVALSTLGFVCAAARACLVFWYSKPVVDDTVEEVATERKRLAGLTNHAEVQSLLLRPRNWLLDNEHVFLAVVGIHIVLLCFNSRALYLAGVALSPLCAAYMQAHHLRPLHLLPKLYSPHVLGWFIVSLAFVAQWIVQLNAPTEYDRLLGCVSYLGLVTLCSIDPGAITVDDHPTERPPTRKRQTVSWILSLSALVCFLGIDGVLLLRGEQDRVLFPLIASAWSAVAFSVPLAYFTTTSSDTQQLGVARVLGIAMWTFSLFLILLLMGGSGGGVSFVSNSLAYSQSALASLLAQGLLARGDMVFISQFFALACSLVFLYLFLPSLRWFLDYPMWYYAYYFKSWKHSISPDGHHPYKDVVVVRNQRFQGNGVMDVMVPRDGKGMELAAPVVFTHGGGHLVCLREIFIHSMTPLSRAGLCLYAVEYPLSPEARFPQALITVLFALNHLWHHHCVTGCCVRGEAPQQCSLCVETTTVVATEEGGMCRCCRHFCGAKQVQLLGDSAGGNLAALVCAVLYNPKLFHMVFSNCDEYAELKTMEFPNVTRLGLIYGLVGMEVNDEDGIWWNHLLRTGYDFLLQQYAPKQATSSSLPPPVLLNDFLQQNPCPIQAFCPETLLVVGTRDPLLYPNRLAHKLLQSKFPSAKVNLLEMPGSFHGFHGLPPQWNWRWKADALPTTSLL